MPSKARPTTPDHITLNSDAAGWASGPATAAGASVAATGAGVDASGIIASGRKPKGIWHDSRRPRSAWVAQISTVKIGRFRSEREAAAAYDRAALMSRGLGAEINYSLSDYLDGKGNLIEDPALKPKLKTLGKTLGRGRWAGRIPFSHGICLICH